MVTGFDILEYTEMVRATLTFAAPEGIQSVDTTANLYLGVSSGYVGAFEFKDENGRIWSVSVKLSERLGAN